MDIDRDVEESVKKMLVVWYGPQADNWRVNDRVVLAVAEILEATGECSSVFRYVPTPAGAFTGGGQMGKMALSYAIASVKRAAADEQMYYLSCVKRKALERRTEMDRAVYGY